MSATTRTSLSSACAEARRSAGRAPASTASPAGGSAAPREAQSLAQIARASRGVMRVHQRPRSGTTMQRRRRAVRKVREKLAQARSGAATVVAETDRLGAMKFGPATQIGQLVVAEHGERAAERLGSLHGRRFTGDMMSKWHDVLSMPSDSMSHAHAADSLPRSSRGRMCLR